MTTYLPMECRPSIMRDFIWTMKTGYGLDNKVEILDLRFVQLNSILEVLGKGPGGLQINISQGGIKMCTKYQPQCKSIGYSLENATHNLITELLNKTNKFHKSTDGEKIIKIFRKLK